MNYLHKLNISILLYVILQKDIYCRFQRPKYVKLDMLGL